MSNNSKRVNSPRRNAQPQSTSSPRTRIRARREEVDTTTVDGDTRGSHSSGWREDGLSCTDYGGLMDNLENAEQTLIEHMRTAGMKKTRECQLIDELLNLRKSRRQAFALLTKDVTNTRDYQEEQNQKSKHQLSQMKQVVIELQNDVEKKDYTLRNIQNEFKKKLEDVHLNYRKIIKNEVDDVKAKYAKNLSLLETKIEQVQQATGKDNGRETKREEEQAQRLQMVLEENNQRQHEKYNVSMQRYKDALKDLVEKEKKLQDSCQQQVTQIESLTLDNKQQKEYIDKMSERLTVAKERVASTASSRSRMEKRLVQLTEKTQQLEAAREDDAHSARSITDDAISSIQARHVHELQLVDEKVRQALHKKDDIILNLRSQLDQIHKESKEAESLLMVLNSNIQSASSQNRSGRR